MKRQLMVDSDIVFNRNGRVFDQSSISTFDKATTIITYLDIKALDFVLGDTPRGKINSIINDNPAWCFVFILNAQLKDSTTIVNKLNQYECDFPIILDIDHKFKDNNHLGNVLATSYVYEKYKVINLGVIGSSKSFFDEEFNRYKNRRLIR